MSLSFVAFVSCNDDKDNPVNNENTRTENSNGGNGGSNDNGSQLSNDSQPKNGSQPGNVAENSSSVVYYSGKEGGRSYVDLGLTSGTKWATCNVGATKPEEYGNYYAWGEVIPKTEYTADNYKYSHGFDGYIKYSGYYNNIGYNSFYDNKYVLELIDDVVYVNWGGKWRMPTNKQTEELLKECYWVWTDSYNGSGVIGFIVYKAKSSIDKGQKIYKGDKLNSQYSLSDAHIFLPSAGMWKVFLLEGVGVSGDYWSSSLDYDYAPNTSSGPMIFYNSDFAIVLGFLARYLYDGRVLRRYGLPVRAVIPGNK